MTAKSIRAQTMWATGAVITVILAAALAITLTLARRELFALGSRHASEQAEAIAARSQFAIIAGRGAPAVVQKLLTEVVGHNEILAAALTDDQAGTLGMLETRKGLLERCPMTDTAALSTTVNREGPFWCTSAPVFSRTIGGACRTRSCLLGRLILAVSAAPTQSVLSRLTTAIWGMSALLLVAAMLSLWWVSGHISAPLMGIVQAMRRSAADASEATGPEEARTIARVYNRLITRQASVARELEERVEQRTRELHEATEEVKKAERYRTAFVVQMSHEMRTPLHIIRAQAGEVLHELEFWKGGAKARANTNLILQESSELAHRVDQVLALVRSASTREAPQLEAVDLASLKDYLLEKSSALAAERGNSLLIEGDDRVIETDRDKVLQILNNLIDNACKYTANGTITVELRQREAGLALQVSDTGIGIAADKLDEVWKEFRQAPSQEGVRPDGFGLGLAIVRARVSELGGVCALESAPGKGTRVTITLPSGKSASRSPSRSQPT